MNSQQRSRMERAYGNVSNRMVNYTRSKGLMNSGSMKYYDRKVSARIRQGRSAQGLSNG
jgi:hypothetical protein